MRLDRFDLNLLITLDALLQERSVTKAADRVHLGASAASAALGRLREHYDDELLTLVGREMVLTPLARSLKEPVREALVRARAAISLRPDFDPQQAEGSVWVRASEYVTQVFLVPLAQRLSALAPGITMKLQGMTPAMFDTFERGGTDLLILPERYANRIEHPKQQLFRDDHVAIAWRDHPDIQGSLSMAQYLSTPQVGVSRYLPGGEAFEDWLLGGLAQRPRTEITVENPGGIPAFVVGTRRIAQLQRRVALQVAQQLPLQVLELPVQLPPLVEVMCWPRHLDGDPRHRWMRQLCVECAQGLDPAPAPAPTSAAEDAAAR